MAQIVLIRKCFFSQINKLFMKIKASHVILTGTKRLQTRLLAKA